MTLLRLTNLYLVVLCIGVVGLLTRHFLTPGLPVTHDGENHVARFAQYKLALRQGQFPPRWAPNLINGYGYPVFNYNYPLLNILSLPFSLVKTSYIVTFKVLMTAGVVGGVLGVVVLSSVWQMSPLRTGLAVCLYGLSPYLLTSILFRGSIGEVWLYALLPWCLWSGFLVARLNQVQWRRWGLLVCVGIWTALLLSHNVGVLLSLPVLLILLAFWLPLTPVVVARGIAVLGLSIGASWWFWFPALMEKSFIVLGGASLSNTFANHFVTVSQLISGPLVFGFSFPGSVDSLSFVVGTLQWAVILTMGVFLYTRSGRKALAAAALCGVTLALWWQTASSHYWWQSVALWRFIQFPWRWGLVIPVFLLQWWLAQSKLLPHSWVIVLAILCGLQAAHFVTTQPVDYTTKSNFEYETFAQSTTTGNENLSESFSLPLSVAGGRTAEFLTGTGGIEVSNWNGTIHTYRVTAKSDSVIIEPTMWFQGWQTWVRRSGESRQQVANEFTSETQGRVAYRLGVGEWEVQSQFTQWTWARVIGNSVSVVAVIIILGITLVGWKRQPNL
jgi:hypothetical protein